MMRCNKCWKVFDVSTETSYITSCCHIFCEDCATKQFTKERVCLVCDTPLTHRGGISANVLTMQQDKIVALCGLPPKDIMKVCHQALEFWSYQVSIGFENEKAEIRRGTAKAQQIEKMYNEKLEDASGKIMQLKRQIEVMRKDGDSDKKEIQDLQEKYSEKSRQKRKLEELYDQLKMKYGGPGLPRGLGEDPSEMARKNTAPPYGRSSDMFAQKPAEPHAEPPRDIHMDGSFMFGRKQQSPSPRPTIGGLGMSSNNSGGSMTGMSMGGGPSGLVLSTPRRPTVPKPSIRIPESPKFPTRNFGR
eukprot:TRINITY_DN8867_c0_g1_i5.p1 TRINITY_DN8867_c0_g1~~TRINITY_DN8867_c0_g1_i5.p1  ORF type:complete len:303 (+),score=55.10 TRINITY_DN8867_c0_g1_i5:166-1074(+)